MKTECLYIVFYIVRIMINGNLLPEGEKIKKHPKMQQKER